MATRLRRGLAAAALTAAGALALSGCVGAHSTTTSDTQRNADAKKVTLQIAANSVIGGKSDAQAEWITKYVIPRFEAMEKVKGVDATVTFQGSGVDDDQYKTKLELGLRTNSAADVDSIDGIWLGELAAAGYVKPLSATVGDTTSGWNGWSQIPKTVQGNLSYQGQRYGIPDGTDGRVIFYDKQLFAKAGLPTDWQPKSWDDILAAGRKLKSLAGVTPIQIDAGTPMGEATTTQGFLPLLAGTSQPDLYSASAKTWQGATPQVTSVLDFYRQVYGTGLGDPKLQEDQAGRDRSFAEFSKGQLGIIFESDYLWRSIVCPDAGVCGATSMPDRNSVVGYAQIPSKTGGKDVSISGGGGWVIKPRTKYPQQAWDLVTFMNSKAALVEEAKTTVRITSRKDVNDEVLANDPCLTFIADRVLPTTRYRPSDEHYDQVSTAIQQATADVVSGTAPSTAAATYEKSVTGIVGAKHVAGR